MLCSVEEGAGVGGVFSISGCCGVVERFEGGVFAFELGDEGFEGADGVFGVLGPGGGDDEVGLLADGVDGVVDGAGDADFVVGGFGGAFAVGEDFFKEFFAGAQAGVADGDVDVGPKAGEGDHAPGEVFDFDGFAHVEDVDFAALAHGAGLQDEAAGFGDGHEVADDVGVGDGDGAAFGDLFAEAGDDAAVAAEDVAEAGGGVAGGGAGGCGLLGVAVLRGCGRGVAAALVQGGVEGLDVHFGGAFGGAHDVGGVDGFVGGDHDELPDVVFAGEFGDVDGAGDVGDDAFAGVFFDEGDVFVGGGVEDDVGVVGGDDGAAAFAVANVGHDGDDGGLRVFGFDFEPDEVQRGFGVVEQDEFLRGEAAELADEFAADGAGSSGDHDDFAADLPGDALGVDGDFGPFEEVFDLDAGDGGGGAAVGEFGGDEEFDAGAAPGDEAVFFGPKEAGGGEDDGFGDARFDVGFEFVDVVAGVDAVFSYGEVAGFFAEVDEGGG